MSSGIEQSINSKARGWRAIEIVNSQNMPPEWPWGQFIMVLLLMIYIAALSY